MGKKWIIAMGLSYSIQTTAQRLGLAVENYEGDFNCPPDQRKDDEAERVYRMKQLTQNINGLIQVATMDLPK